ncbi:hypothetical protein CW744_13040 [Staphylococcus xylosus]|nr:hypothetical protein CW744_13040 [Staphylococcus xylosus]
MSLPVDNALTKLVTAEPLIPVQAIFLCKFNIMYPPPLPRTLYILFRKLKRGFLNFLKTSIYI